MSTKPLRDSLGRFVRHSRTRKAMDVAYIVMLLAGVVGAFYLFLVSI